MSNFFSRFIKDMINKSIYDIIKTLLVLFITSGSLGFLANALSSKIQFLRQYTLFVAIMAAAAVCLAVMALYDRLSANYVVIRDIESCFRILKKEYTYTYKNRNNMTFRKKLTLKVLKNNTACYHDRYFWTGHGNTRVTSEHADQEYVETIRKDVYQEYVINFDRNLKKGEIIETSLFFTLEDLDNKAIPFLSTTISEPTDYLSMKVKVPVSFRVEKAIAEIFPCADSYIPVKTEIIMFNSDGEVEWNVKNPKRFHLYSLRWKM